VDWRAAGWYYGRPGACSSVATGFRWSDRNHIADNTDRNECL
jgi:hypothetical protein